MTDKATRFTAVGWMADNPVAANLLMIAMLISGVLGFLEIRQEITPKFSLNAVSISVAYPGAAPQQVEDGIILPIEKELTGMTGIRSLVSTANEGSGRLIAELQDNADPAELLQNIRSALSRITAFPDDAEPPRVELREHVLFVISIAVATLLPVDDLFELSERIRRELLDMPGVAEVGLRGRLDPQIRIEITDQRLRALGLSIGDLAQAIRTAARDVPAGGIESSDGEILLRTQGRRIRAQAFADIPIKVQPDGSQVLLGEVAELIDGFTEADQIFEFNGRRGLRLDVYQAENQRPLELASRVRQLVEDLNAELPPSVTISVHNDRSERFAERSEILLKNGAIGLILVIITLGIFLSPRLAFWVAISIPVVFVASFGILNEADIALNMISMFAFILTLGIVVDDAIIVGENVHAKVQQGLPRAMAVREGAREMVVPVVYAVGTNIIAFIPLMFVPGATGQFLRDLPMVASIVFLVSLVEALFILPAHLNAEPAETQSAWRRYLARFKRTRRLHDQLASSLDRLRDGPYRRLLDLALRERYLTLILFSGAMLLVVVWYQSGRMDLTWNPQIPGDRIDAELTMPVDATIEETSAVVKRIEAAALRAAVRLGDPDQHLQSWFTQAKATSGDVNVYLVAERLRPFTPQEFAGVWREEIGDLPEARSLFFDFLVGPGGSRGLRINLSHSSTEALEDAARELALQLGGFAGLVDISDGIGEGKRQIGFILTPLARSIGLDETLVGRQVRDAFFGAEALRLLRDGYEIKVMVRLPKTQRDSIEDVRNFILRGPGGIEMALSDAADFREGNAYSSIHREDGKRSITVSASFDPQRASERRIRDAIETELMPELLARHPGLEWQFSGGRRDRNDALGGIIEGLLWVMLVIYALTAALFRSYVAGLIVMLTIPYSVAAAIAGHILMGFDLSSVSIFGMIALSGLVVNGALVLTLRYRQLLTSHPPQLALREAATSRFRPIALTSLTTTAGLFPMLFETSTQALFLVPMAIALSFGTLASTLVILLLIPALHAIYADLRRL